MRRIILLLAMAAVMAVMLVATAVPALAQTRTFPCKSLFPSRPGVTVEIANFDVQIGPYHFACTND